MFAFTDHSYRAGTVLIATFGLRGSSFPNMQVGSPLLQSINDPGHFVAHTNVLYCLAPEGSRKEPCQHAELSIVHYKMNWEWTVKLVPL